MAQILSNSFHQFDYILDKPTKKLELVENKPDDGGAGIPNAVDAFLSSVVEAYGMVGEMTSADKQQVSVRLAAVKEKSVQCNHEMIGGSFDGGKWKCIARSVMSTLVQTVEESRQSQMLRQLQLCEHNLCGILKCKFMEIILTDYKRLLANTSRLLEYIYKYLSWGTLKGKQTQNILLLCASQLQKLFPLLLHALEITDNLSEPCVELKNYIVERMKVCLSKIKKGIEGAISEDDECDDLGGGLFIAHMDQALSYLAVFDSANCHSVLYGQWRAAVEAVLQHAMSIAQIVSEFDFRMIHSSGEKILRECDNLEKEHKSANSNASLCKLYANSLSNALEELEQRVCASVLKMYLQVFSNPFAPLQDLCKQCLASQPVGSEHNIEDLSNSILNFDTHTDCILQVAVFAMACSEDQNRVLGIRSCLASLESLEAHLVPSLSALYLKQAPKQLILARALVEHWSSEVKLLWQHIDGIVDPAALAQVTHNVIWAPTAILKKSIVINKVLEEKELKKLVRAVVSNAEVLCHQLGGSADDLKVLQSPPIQQAMKELLQAVREGKAVLQKMDGQNSSLSKDRILKRCELIVTCVGNIQPLLEEIDNPESKRISPVLQEGSLPSLRKEESVVQNISHVTHDSLREQLVHLGLPSDAEIEIDTTDATGAPGIMLSFLEKTSAQPRFMTSFLYNEKKKKTFQALKSTPRHTPSSHAFSRKTIESQQPQLLQQTFSLDISKLVSLSDTLRCSSNVIIEQASIEKTHNTDSDLGENSSKNISTPERMKDLLQVQSRIDAVKISSQPFFSHQLL